MTVFETTKLLTLISRKFLVAVNSLNFLTEISVKNHVFTNFFPGPLLSEMPARDFFKSFSTIFQITQRKLCFAIQCDVGKTPRKPALQDSRRIFKVFENPYLLN